MYASGMYQAPKRKASRFEILGAWLHIWTPPRGVEIPPVPWRKIAIRGAIGAVLLGIVLAIMVPRIDATKEKTAADDAAFRAKVRSEHVARVSHAQRASFGEARELRPEAGAAPEEVQAARGALITLVQDDMYADAKARAAKGEIRPVTAAPTCERAPGSPTDGVYGVFDCFIQTSPVRPGKRNVGGALGYPFRAVVHYDTFKYAWCRAEPIPGEKLVVDANAAVQLPAACQREQG
jgi:hypothetical protein